jgi:predicted nuclease of predicted toxin-antitoxin system
MKILVDENIPRMTVNRLRTLGHDVKGIRGTQSQGLPDSDFWNMAVAEQRVLVSTDKGFTDYRWAARRRISVVRPRQPNRLKIHQAVLRAAGCFGCLVAKDQFRRVEGYPPSRNGLCASRYRQRNGG